MRANIKSAWKINEIFFVFSLIFKNLTFFSHTSILTKNYFLVILKVKYQKGNFASCSSFQNAFQAEKLMNIFNTLLNDHPVHVQCIFKEGIS